jgi:hypothetical protein
MTATPAFPPPAPAGYGFADPFPHFIAPDFLGATAAARLNATLDRTGAWEMRQESFYDHWSCELYHSDRGVPAPPVIAEMLERAGAAVVEHFGAVLADARQALAHRMGPHNRIGVHNDAPALGYEAYRVLVYLDRPARRSGQLHLHGAERDGPVRSIAPEPGLAVGMALGRRSYHSVAPLAAGRRTAIVLNFWHAGNSPAIERAIRDHVDRLAELDDPLRSRLNLLLAACRAVPDARDAHAANLAARTLAGFGAPEAASIALFLALIPRESWGVAPVLAGAAAAAAAERLRAGLAGEAEAIDASSLVAAALARLGHGTFEASDWENKRARLARLAPLAPASPAGRWRDLLFP